MATLLADTWTGADDDPWDSGKWTVTNGDGLLDIQSNEGRFASGTGAPPKAVGIHTAEADCDLLLKFRASATDRDTRFRATLRGNGSWDTTVLGEPDEGYWVEKVANSSTATLYKKTSAGSTTSITTFTWTADINAWWLRFQTEGTALRVRVWQDGGSEPGTWDVDTTDSDVSAAGNVQVSWQRIAGGGQPGFIDDLTLSDLAAAADPANLQASVTDDDVTLTWDASF